MTTRRILVAAAACFTLFAAGCKEDSAAENAANEAGDAMEEAADAAGDAMDDAADAVDDAMGE